FVCSKQFSILLVLSIDGYLSYDIFEIQLWGKHLRNSLDQLPLMCPYPWPQSLLLLNNCSIHHGLSVK
ncbi:hypothetical protein BS47DRAFT_1244164, partial [Hydnum rufescens UP504]